MPCRDTKETMEDVASRERRHMLVRCLCHACEHLEAAGQHDAIAANPELAEFWAEHQAADARRAEEAALNLSARDRRRREHVALTDDAIIAGALVKLRHTLTQTEARLLRRARGWPWCYLPDSLDRL